MSNLPLAAIMPVVAFAFGSLGDITALLQLTWKLSTTLANLTGTSGELGELLEDVDAFARALKEVQAAIDGRRISLQSDVVTGIKHSLTVCYCILRGFQRKIETFQAKMTGRLGPGFGVLRKYWALVAWEILGGRTEVNALRTRLREHVSVMQTYLSLAQSSNQTAIAETAESHRTTVDKIWDAVQNMERNFSPTIPSFKFFDQKERRYYLPCARTSLQRLIDLFSRTSFIESLWGVRLWHPWFYFECIGSSMGYASVSLREALDAIGGVTESGAYITITSWTREVEEDRSICLSCFAFIGASGEAEVLIGFPAYEGQRDRIATQDFICDLFTRGRRAYPAHEISTRPATVYEAIRNHANEFSGLGDTYLTLVRWSLDLLQTPSQQKELSRTLWKYGDADSLMARVAPWRPKTDSFPPPRLFYDEMISSSACCPKLEPELVELFELDQTLGFDRPSSMRDFLQTLLEFVYSRWAPWETDW